MATKSVPIENCIATHKAVNDKFIQLSNMMVEIKDNHLGHLKQDVTEMRAEFKVILEQYQRSQKFMQVLILIMLSIISGIEVIKYIGGVL